MDEDGLTASPPFPAGFASRCGMCDGDIEEGDEIVRLEDEDEWVHKHCAEREGYRIGGAE